MNTEKTRHKSAAAKNIRLLPWFRRVVTWATFPFLLACTSVSDVANDYRSAIASNGGDKPGAETTFLFLVDGLSAPFLERALMEKSAPSIAAFFTAPAGNITLQRSSWYSVLKRKPVFPRGRASFPTLTYPNLVSILTGLPVAAHGIIGNRVIEEGKTVVNLENVLAWKTLDSRIGDRTVFSRLHGRGEASVSFSYPFPYASTAKQQANLNAALSYASKDYLSIDITTLASVTELLKSSPPADWPRFIFVHLIALDSIAHENGPDAPEMMEAFKKIDLALSGIFLRILEGEERGRHIDVALTADHGFVAASQKIPIDEIAKSLRREIQIVTDNRMAAVYVPASWAGPLKAETAEAFLQVKKIAWSAWRENISNEKAIEILFQDGRRARIDLAPAVCESGPWAARFRWMNTPRSQGGPHRCPEAFDSLGADLATALLVPALVEYFTAPSAPDIVLVPEVGFDFVGGYKGNHGGLTPEESLVPILARHTDLGSGVIPTHRLLKLLHLLP